RPRWRLLGGFGLGVALAVLPLFLFEQGRVLPYFNRATDHNVIKEIRYNRSPIPLLAVAADGLAAPWLADPTPRHDLSRSRLALLGLPLAIALGQSLLAPRRELSALLVLQAGTAFAASVVAGQSGHPNGLRYGYLATLTAVAVAAGILALVGRVPTAHRRAAA